MSPDPVEKVEHIGIAFSTYTLMKGWSASKGLLQDSGKTVTYIATPSAAEETATIFLYLPEGESIRLEFKKDAQATIKDRTLIFDEDDIKEMEELGSGGRRIFTPQP